MGDKRKESNLRGRHFVRSKYIVEVNKNLTPLQRERLETTPFKSLVNLESQITISGPLLREFLKRWDTHSLGVRVLNRVISFSKLDVCIGLGIRIVGEPVIDDNTVDCRVKQLLDGGVIRFDGIVEKMSELSSEERVDDFCRLYILLAFGTIYFPQSKQTIKTAPFSLLDDLDRLDTYDWGGRVYDKLVKSLNQVAPRVNESRNSESGTIAGCAALLQIWVVEHFMLRDSENIVLFPRILSWVGVGTGDRIVHNIFEGRKFVEDVPLTAGEQSNEVLNQAFVHIGMGGRVGMFSGVEEMKNKLLTIEDEIKVYKTLYPESPSSRNRLHVSENVAEASYVATEAILPKMTRDATNLSEEVLALYHYCTRKEEPKEEVLVSMNSQMLTREDIYTLRPRGWVGNMVLYFAPAMMMMMMKDEIERTGSLSRLLFNYTYCAEVIGELNKSKAGRGKSWPLRQHFNQVNLRALKLNPRDLLKSCNMIFAPALYQSHWMCYVVVQHERKMYVLDSLYSANNRNNLLLDLDEAMRLRFEDLLSYVEEVSLEIVYEEMPKQKNFHDCGMYVLKYLEFWNGQGTMPEYSLEDIVNFRQQTVLKWVLDGKNNYKSEVLRKANVKETLEMY